jgi:predicted TIM-barrel fold metal-dependent hydrolase
MTLIKSKKLQKKEVNNTVIVDGHTHITTGQGDSAAKFDWSDLDHWLSSNQRSKAVVMPTIEQFSDSVAINRQFFEKLRHFLMRSRVFPFLWVHPQRLLESHFREFTFSGFKFHPSISQTTISENLRVLDLCEKYRKPILIHCGRGEKSRIDYVLQVNTQYPSVKFICAHMGGLATDLIIRAMDLMGKSKSRPDNVYLDTSGCFYPRLICKAVELLGDDKIIFGTDRPFHDYEVSFYAIKCCHLTEETERKIFAGNIQDIV